MKIRQRLQRLRLAIKGGITIWQIGRTMSEKKLALLNKLTDLGQQAAEAIADYTESEKDDQWVRQLNPFVDMIQQYLMRMKSGS